jgi:hypothetical protein
MKRLEGLLREQVANAADHLEANAGFYSRSFAASSAIFLRQSGLR